MRHIALIFFLVFISSCSKSLDVKVEEMVAAKNKWIGGSVGKDHSYTLHIQGHHVNSIQQINVVAGRAINKEPDDIATIRSLFELAFDALKNAKNDMDITYNPIYGYPSKIEIRMPNNIHGQITIVVKNFTITGADKN